MKFPKHLRLLKKHDFHAMKSGSRRVVGKCLCIDFKPATAQRLGITASGRYGPSCERNRFKRLVREAFRTQRHQLPLFELHVVPRQYAKTASLHDVASEFLQLLSK